MPRSPRDTQEKQKTSQIKLDELIAHDHALVRISSSINWSKLSERFEKNILTLFDAQSLSPRLLVGLSLLRQLYNLTDESLYQQWPDNPYFQYFCGEETFQHTPPFSMIMLRMLPRLGERELRALLNNKTSEFSKLVNPQTVLHEDVAPNAPPSNAPLSNASKFAESGHKPTSIYDVAKRAGVSIKTVSFVINGHANVSEHTRNTVLAAIKELSYRPNVFARGLAAAHSNLIAMLYDGPGEFVASAEAGALERCRERGYHLIVESLSASSPDIRKKTHKLIDGASLYGAIVLPPLCDMPEVMEELVKAKLRCVRIASGKVLPNVSSVGADDYRVGYDMTAYLIGIGHRRIGFISGLSNHYAVAQRFEGYKAALSEAGLPFDETLFEQGQFTLESGWAATERLLKQKKRPTAIFAASDHMAAGALGQAQKMRIRVPEDISVVGVDDSVIALTVWPQLTTCHTPIREWAATAASLLLNDTDKSKATNIVLEHKLVVRGSSAPPPAE